MDIKPGDMHYDIFLGNTFLGYEEDNLVNLLNMKKATKQEIDMMRISGMQVGSDETIYTGESIEVFGRGWSPLVVVKNGKVSMITVQLMLKDKKIINSFWDIVVKMYTDDLGKPTKQTDKQIIWDLSHHRRVVLGKRK